MTTSTKRKLNTNIGTSVVVIAGKYKGTEGKITGKKGDYLYVDSLPELKKCKKADRANGKEGGIFTTPRPIHMSNVRSVGEEIENE
jgi:ribosomal protein L24